MKVSNNFCIQNLTCSGRQNPNMLKNFCIRVSSVNVDDLRVQTHYDLRVQTHYDVKVQTHYDMYSSFKKELFL